MIRKQNIVLVALAVVLTAGLTYANANPDLGQRIHHEIAMIPNATIWDWIEADLHADGSVVLRGEVTRPTIKDDAEYRLKHLEGVTNVTDDIKVLPLSSFDDQIRVAVYRSLFNRNSTLNLYAMGANPSIHIIVDNGTVTLKGIVANAMDRQIAGMAANGVFGVLKVENELQLASRS
jgi:hyperosmotically inducible protein